MQRVVNYWIFASVMLLAAGEQLYYPAPAAMARTVLRALGMFDISVGGAVLGLCVLAKLAARHMARKNKTVSGGTSNAKSN